MSLPTVVLKQSSFATVTVSSSTFHSSFTPSGLGSAGYLICMSFQWTTTSRTITSVVTTGITWLAVVPKYIPTGQGATALYLGLATSTGAKTTTVTLSGTPGTPAPTMLYDEFQVSGLPSAPSWTVDAESGNFGSSTNPALTSAMAGKYGDFFYSSLYFLAADISSSSNPQSFLTYDSTDQNVYGILPRDETVPATGFQLSANDTWTMPAMILNSGVVPEPTLWVPPGVDLGVF